MDWREILEVQPRDNSDFSEKSSKTEPFYHLKHLNPEDEESIEFRFEWMERAAIMEIDGGLSREEAERQATKIIILKRRKETYGYKN